MLVILNIFKSIIDFVDEKCGKLVDYILGLLESFTTIFQALIIVVIGILSLVGIIAIVKKSAKLIIVIAAILVIVFAVYIFI
jgi:hypothetical protein